MALALVLVWVEGAGASGVLRNGIGARSMGLAGADASAPADALGAMGGNAAGLAGLPSPELTAGAVLGVGDATFRSASNAGAGLEETWGIAPELGLAFPAGPLVWGVSAIPEAGRIADWGYVDEPGGLDGVTSYGRQNHESRFATLRTAVGAGWAVNESLWIGASIGGVYHDVRVAVPFIFQEEPTLRGFKTLLDLESDGWGINGDVGVIYRPVPSIDLALRYRSATRLVGTGSASGDAGAQLSSLGGAFAAADPTFRYDAEFETALPQSVTFGAGWRPVPQVSVFAQVDWVNWSDAFDSVDVRLRDGDNADLNSLVGGTALDDRVPVGWGDRAVWRAGVEWRFARDLTLRAGYAYARNPVPTALTTPLNAAISEHTLAVGLGWESARFGIDFAYQWDLPNAVRVGESAYRAGEYSRSSVALQTHWFGLSARYRF